MSNKIVHKKKEQIKEPDWRNKYMIQQLLVDTIISLLKKYGNTLELSVLYREFLLTLMGHFLVSDSSYYECKEESGELVLKFAYGNMQRIPSIDAGCEFISYLKEHSRPECLSDIPEDITIHSSIHSLRDKLHIAAPIMLKDKLLGLVLLGNRISKQTYSEADRQILHTLCNLSAVTYNNAMLYENAKMSLMELQRLMDVRNEMISRIDHEFRTPLTIIKAGLEAMNRKGYSKSLQEGLMQAVTNLETMITVLLELHQSVYDEESNSRYTINPTRTIQESITKQVARIREKKLQLEFKDLMGGSDLQCKITESNLKNMIEIFIDNAIKYSDDCSRIIIETRVASKSLNDTMHDVKISNWIERCEKSITEYRSLTQGSPASSSQDTQNINRLPENNSDGKLYLFIRISDSGIGIPEKDLEFLGEPFRQASNSPDQGIKGKALALALAHKIILESGGDLYCSSKVGVGTVFTIFLPLQ